MNKITARTKRKIVQNIVGYLYVAPVILGVLFFTLTPVLYAFINSFFETPLRPFSLTEWGTFVGLKNYYQNFTNYYYRTRFFTSLGVTFLYAVTYIPRTGSGDGRNYHSLHDTDSSFISASSMEN